MGTPLRRTAARRAPAAAAAAELGLLALLQPGPAGWAAGAAHAVISTSALAAALHRWQTSCGPADLVTLTRSVLAGAVTALVADRLTAGTSPALLLTALATTALVLDGVDGAVARRTGTASPLGARFDMEVDAYLVLVLSASVAADLGAWVLAIGLMRYTFALAAHLLPRLRAPLPPSRARKAAAAIQGTALVAAASGVLARPAAAAAVAAALLVLFWSFGRDITWLHRHAAVRHRAAAEER